MISLSLKRDRQPRIDNPLLMIPEFVQASGRLRHKNIMHSVGDERSFRHKKVIDRPHVFCYILRLSVPPQEIRNLAGNLQPSRLLKADLMLIKGAGRETAS